MILKENYLAIKNELNDKNVQLIAVSKTKPVADLQALFLLGQKAFGENYVQELVEKQPQLSAEMEWHFIGHLQSNKVKMIAPFVHTIHAVDSLNLVLEIEKQAAKFNRTINCLLQIHIADEATKFGLTENELIEILEKIKSMPLKHTVIAGLMGMATFTDDESKIENEFRQLKLLFKKVKNDFFKNEKSFQQISMGMSSDYKIAVAQGSTMVRIGGLIFGERNYQQ